MRDIAVYAGFYAFFGVFEVSAAVFAKGVQRTITEKTVEIFKRHIFMAREIFTGSVLIKIAGERL